MAIRGTCPGSPTDGTRRIAYVFCNFLNGFREKCSTPSVSEDRPIKNYFQLCKSLENMNL
jgi:hypothetical protein